MNDLNPKVIKRILRNMEFAIEYSLSHGLNLHTDVGGKYGELYVASALWKHDPRMGAHRKEVKEVDRPKSCDIVLASTNKKLEVKWAVPHYYHYNDRFVKRRRKILYWGWGFSDGSQFIDRSFDYCILLAAEKGGAKPKHIFVLKCEEMTDESMGGKRRSPVNESSYYIQFSKNRKFYYKREWYPKGPAPIEEALYKNMKEYKKRWALLKKKGYLD